MIASLDYGAYVITIASIAVIALQLIGERLYALSGAGGESPQGVVRTTNLGDSITWVVVLLGAFAALDIVNAFPSTLPGLPLSIFPSDFGRALTLAGLFTTQIAIGEAHFFQGGLANIASRYLGGPVSGIVLVTAAAFAFHLFAIPSLLTVGIVAVDFSLQTYVGFRTQRLLPIIVAHLLNNLFSIVFASVIGPSALGLH